MSCCHQGNNKQCNRTYVMWVHVTQTRQDQESMCCHPVGEKIDWIEAVDPSLTGAVELWMGEVEGVIRRTLHKLAGQALAAYATTQRSKWILEWPGQLVLNCSQVSHQKSGTGDTVSKKTNSSKERKTMLKKHNCCEVAHMRLAGVPNCFPGDPLPRHFLFSPV